MSDTITNPENITTSAGRDDAITATASPRPWRVEGLFPGQRETKRQHGFREYANVLDRNGIYIAQNLPPETAALIVEAVNESDSILEKWKESSRNLVAATSDLYAETKRRVAAEAERDSLRDIVRRMAAYIQVGAIGGALLREARAAIGEDRP